jgi:hypothetical protein
MVLVELNTLMKEWGLELFRALNTPLEKGDLELVRAM